MAHTVIAKMDERMQKAIRDVSECEKSCFETFSHCIRLGGKHAEPSHINHLADCIEICRTSASAMLRESEFCGRLCGINAEICEKCAESCRIIDPEDETMRACAEMCSTCADSCRKMESM